MKTPAAQRRLRRAQSFPLFLAVVRHAAQIVLDLPGCFQLSGEFLRGFHLRYQTVRLGDYSMPLLPDNGPEWPKM
jgi:hypothetical protein